jgi:hypothetical protein
MLLTHHSIRQKYLLGSLGPAFYGWHVVYEQKSVLQIFENKRYLLSCGTTSQTMLCLLILTGLYLMYVLSRLPSAHSFSGMDLVYMSLRAASKMVRFALSATSFWAGVCGALVSSGADVQQVIVTVALVEPGLSEGKQIQIISYEMMSDDVNPLE